jgi:hypothetical protein
MKILLITTCAVLTLTLSGCKDKYKEGFDDGFVQGTASTEARLRKEMDEKIETLKRESERSTYNYGGLSTGVCGGGGVTVNGKHHSPGKTGCVRVHSDGRIEKY